MTDRQRLPPDVVALLEERVSARGFYGVLGVVGAPAGMPASFFVALARCAESGVVGVSGAVTTLATFSFFPSKNLGAFGDGGAVTTEALLEEAGVKGTAFARFRVGS